MQKYVIAEALEDEMRLVQMGGKVTQINGKMCFVQFDIDGLIVEYAYNINNKGKFFLERVKPYPLPVKVYEDIQRIIEIIDIDLEQFRQGVKSHNIQKFIKMGNLFHSTAKRFEDLFLYYNVPEDVLDQLIEEMERINDAIDQCKGNAERLYFKKEPDNL